jgi:hypothetical protein
MAKARQLATSHLLALVLGSFCILHAPFERNYAPETLRTHPWLNIFAFYPPGGMAGIEFGMGIGIIALVSWITSMQDEVDTEMDASEVLAPDKPANQSTKGALDYTEKTRRE